MSRFLLLFIITMFPMTVLADMQVDIGLVGFTAWSNHDVYQNPEGIGLFASSHVSKDVQLRIEYSYLDNAMHEFGVVAFGFLPPPDTNRVKESILFSARMNTVAFLVLHRLVASRRFGFGIGGGLRVVHFNMFVRGETTGEMVKVSQGGPGIELLASINVKPLSHLPVDWLVEFAYRGAGHANVSLDGYEPFTSVRMFAVQTGLAWRL